MKVAENLHTTSSRYSGWFPCFKSRGIGPPLYRNQKVRKYQGYVENVLHYGNFSAISMKIGRLYARKICAKCVKTRQKCVLAALALLWSCLRQKIAVEGWVHMWPIWSNLIESRNFSRFEEERRSVDRGKCTNENSKWPGIWIS